MTMYATGTSIQSNKSLEQRSRFVDLCRRFDVAAVNKDRLEQAESQLMKNCDIMAKAITEGLSNETGSLLEEMCDHCYGFEFFLESEDEGGLSSEGESGFSSVKACYTGTIREE